MPWMLLALVFVLMWLSSVLLIGAWLHRQRRPTLADRLAPFQPTISDEAENWLRLQAPTLE